jgi:hypothetical protein
LLIGQVPEWVVNAGFNVGVQIGAAVVIAEQIALGLLAVNVVPHNVSNAQRVAVVIGSSLEAIEQVQTPTSTLECAYYVTVWHLQRINILSVVTPSFVRHPQDSSTCK